jgi:hypothetical protein
MDQDTRLKEYLFRDLARHPQTNQLLRERLEQRVAATYDCLLNPILSGLTILKPGEQLPIERMLQQLTEQLPKAADILRSIFAGIHVDEEGYRFDYRLVDALVEVRLLNFLLENGFRDIDRPSTQNSKAPDFTAFRNGAVYYAEAKTVRDVDNWILQLADDLLNHDRLRHPAGTPGWVQVLPSDKYNEALRTGDVPRPDEPEGRGRRVRQALHQDLGPSGAPATLQTFITSPSATITTADGYITLSFTPTKGMSGIFASTYESSDTTALRHMKLLGRILGKTVEALIQCSECANSCGTRPNYLVFLDLEGHWQPSRPESMATLLASLEREVGWLYSDNSYGPKLQCTLVLRTLWGQCMVAQPKGSQST